MASFEAAIGAVLENEGGYCCQPGDPGGETNYGICRRSYPGLDIKSLTRDEACAIYRRDAWMFDAVDHQAVAGKLLDMVVNLGRRTAIRMAQRSCIALGQPIAADGLWGRKTEAAVNALAPEALLSELRRRMAERYGQLCRRNPGLRKFLKGWLRRAAQ